MCRHGVSLTSYSTLRSNRPSNTSASVRILTFELSTNSAISAASVFSTRASPRAKSAKTRPGLAPDTASAAAVVRARTSRNWSSPCGAPVTAASVRQDHQRQNCGASFGIDRRAGERGWPESECMSRRRDGLSCYTTETQRNAAIPIAARAFSRPEARTCSPPPDRFDRQRIVRIDLDLAPQTSDADVDRAVEWLPFSVRVKVSSRSRVRTLFGVSMKVFSRSNSIAVIATSVPSASSRRRASRSSVHGRCADACVRWPVPGRLRRAAAAARSSAAPAARADRTAWRHSRPHPFQRPTTRSTTPSAAVTMMIRPRWCSRR